MPQRAKASKRLKIAKGADSKHTHADKEAVTDSGTVTDIDTHPLQLQLRRGRQLGWVSRVVEQLS